MYSLRESMWFKFADKIPPEDLSSSEILIAVLVALAIVACWFILRRLFFVIAQRAGAARFTAMVFCICWAFAWLLGSLDLAGFRSFTLMTLIFFLSLVGCIGYLAWARRSGLERRI